MKNNKIKSKTFKQAVEETEEIKNGYQNGLKALGNYSNKVELGDTKKCEGSVAIDDCTESLYPQENRWDYVFGYKGEAYFVEVHSAHTSEVSVVLKKLQWLKDWLNSKAPEIKKLQAKNKAFIWIQTNGNHILPKSSQNRLLAEKGLKPVSKLILD
jgi:hypothetical protein